MTLFTSAGSGNWSTPATWDVGVGYPVPGTGTGADTVEIIDGDVISIDINLNNYIYTGVITITSGELNIALGKTVITVPADLTITTNLGTITDCYGTVTTNSTTGLVTNNEAVTGLVTTNLGTVTNNEGVVTTNGDGGSNNGWIYNHTGTVTANTTTGIIYIVTTGSVGTNDGNIYLTNSAANIGGISIQAITGTVVPAVTNVRDTVVYDGATKMGTCKVPATTKVLSPEPVDATTGTLTMPNTQYVLSTAADYGQGGTGGAKTATIPAVTNVKRDIAYGVNGTGSTGTLVIAGVVKI